MKTRKLNNSNKAVLLKLHTIFLVFAFGLFGCEQVYEDITPAFSEMSTHTQSSNQVIAEESNDDRYKTDTTGQYVSKNVKVVSYNGIERPSRPKYDIQNYSMFQTFFNPTGDYEIEDPNGPCDGCGGGGSVSTFLSSEGLGHVSINPEGYIYALRIINGNNSSIHPSSGHLKINADLNRGAGGDYIYLTFTRDSVYSYENNGVHPAKTYSIPITNIRVEAHTQFGVINDGAPWPSYRHMYKFDGTNSLYPRDLNDGAGGRYIFGHVTRDSHFGSPIKEIGVLYGINSSNMPPAGWEKYPQDLNEGCGGDYIYFCYKK